MPNDSEKKSAQSPFSNKEASRFPILNFLSSVELGILVHFDLSAIAVLGSLELSCSQGKLGFRRPAFRLLCLQTEWMSFLTECRENRGLLAETGRDVTLLCGSLVVRQLVDDAGALGLIHGINLPRSKGLSGVRAQHCFSSP